MADVTISSLPLGTPSGSALLPYSTGNSTLGVPVSAILQNAGNIGIGINSPQNKLHVYDNSNSSIAVGRAGYPQVLATWEYNTGTCSFGTKAVDNLELITSNVSRLFIDSTGSINIPGKLTNAGVPKAWVRFNGAGTIGQNQSITSQYNVSSVSKLGTGKYRVYFTTAMSNINYTITSNGVFFPWGTIPNGNATDGDQPALTSCLNYNTTYFDLYTSTPWIPRKDWAYYYDSLNVHAVVFGN